MADSKQHLKPEILKEVRTHGNLTRAARRVGVDRRTVFRWRETDTKFGEKIQEAIEEATK